MPRLTAIIALLALGAAGCGANAQKAANIPPPASSAPASPSPSPTPSLSAAELKAKLLTLKDLPTGYSQTPTSSPGADDNSEKTGCPAIDKLGQTSSGGGQSVEADFAKESNHSQIQQTVEQSSDAKAELDQFRSAFTSCKSFSSDGATIHITETPFPKTGDEVVAMHLTTAEDSVTVGTDLVVVRVGDLVTLVATISLKPDHALTQRLVNKAVANLKAEPGIRS